MEITRRNFVKTAGVLAGAFALKDALALDILLPVQDTLGAYPYRGWEVFYRDLWNFDYFGRVAHSVNCTGSCTWKVYVKNDVAFKEEQFADYPEINAEIPVYNPRGCQKGANHKEYVYGAQRTKYPLKKVGARDSGCWQRLTWDEALTEIADKILDTVQKTWTDASGNTHYSPDQVHFYAAIPAKHQITVAGGFRLANLLGAPVMSFYDWYCDLPPGEPMTWAVQTDSCESADWYNSDYIMLMGANLLETRIPDSHYFEEARYKGTKIVAVFPDYNPVSIHADTYVPIKPGTDAALCLGMTKYIIDNGLHDVPYIKKYTDMPFLIYTEGPYTGKFVRADQTLSPDGSPADPAAFNTYYVYNRASRKIVPAPGTQGSTDKTLDLGSIDPALDVPSSTRFNGYRVTTVFSLLTQKIGGFTTGNVAKITGLSASLIAKLSEEFAAAKAARIIEGAGTNHWFHNDLTNRSQILLLAITGNVGKPGTGFDHYVGQEKIWPEEVWFHTAYPHGRPRQRFQNTTLWTYYHADVWTHDDVDALGIYPKKIIDYIKESVSKRWMPLWPEGTINNGRLPKVMFIWGANYINQAKGYNDLMETLIGQKFDNPPDGQKGIIVDVNVRMDTSAFFADYVLPAASMFEKFDLNTTDLHTYAIPFTPVIDLQYESKTDWQIWRALAAKIQERALAKGFTQFDDDFFPFSTGTSLTRKYDTLASDFDTMSVTPLPGMNTLVTSFANDRDVCQFILDNAPETQGFTVDGDYRLTSDFHLLAQPNSSIIKHPKRFPATSETWTTTLKPGVAYYCFQRMFEELKPLGTQTGRQQFYIDHDWMLDFKEELPVYNGTIDADPHPLRWSTPHGRWSIHSTWRDAKFQLRLQRSRTVVYLNPAEAAKRGLKDNDLVEVFNGHGAVQVHLDISSRIPPGQALMYHGWERYQNNTGWQAVTGIRINPVQLIGKYGQMTFRLNYWGPTGNQKDTLVDIRKA